MKNYKVSYKTYFSDRLKEVFFHGIKTYPLYIQLTYKRRTMFFKSYYFELLSKDRYAIKTKKSTSAPTLEAIIKKEHALIDFLIEKKLTAGFSLEEFKQAYDYYCRDLITETEEGVRAMMFVFFVDKDLVAMGRALAQGSMKIILYDVLKNMSLALTPKLFKDMSNYMLNQPYQALYEFLLKNNEFPMFCLTVMDLETEDMRQRLNAFLNENYAAKNISAIKEGISYWLLELKKLRSE